VKYVPVLLEGDPREVLLRIADDENVDLVVVGTRGAGAAHPSGVRMGSVTHHLVHHSRRPVAIIPATTVPAPPIRIVVGVDGSSGSAGAVQWCKDLAARLHAEVVAVYAEVPLAEWVPHFDPSSWYQVALRHCRDWDAALHDAGIATRETVVEHRPSIGIAEVAIRTGAGLIVLGTRGRGRVPGLRLGSTALKVLDHGGVPVVVVPPVTQ
jgi:nucleotide-binding universal stress UspA family protein